MLNMKGWVLFTYSVYAKITNNLSAHWIKNNTGLQPVSMPLEQPLLGIKLLDKRCHKIWVLQLMPCAFGSWRKTHIKSNFTILNMWTYNPSK